MFRPDNQVSVVLLGECHISVAGKYLSGVPYGLFRIAAYILLEGRGRPVARRRMGSLLWSDSDPAQASADIRQTIARIRRFQAEHGFQLIAADATSMWHVESPEVFCDLEAFLDHLEDPDPTSSVALCQLYGGELLGSLGSSGAAFEDWLAYQRPRLHDEFAGAVARAISSGTGLTAQQRDYCARRLMKIDPCHEGAYRALMNGAAENGQTSAVRHIFDDYTRKLMDELGVGPDAQMIQLFETLTRGGATVPS